jgi:L-malate glycosyltransferase
VTTRASAGPRRILVLTTVMTTGGVQKAVMQLARGLTDRGHQVTVVVMYDKSGVTGRYEAEFGLPIQDLGMNPSGSVPMKLGAMVRGVYRLWRLLRREGIDVLQSFTHYSNILGPIMGVAAGVPVRITSQRTLLEGRSRWLRVADRIVSRLGLAQRMVAVSDATRRFCVDVEGLRPERVVTIPNGVDLNAVRPLEDGPRRMALRSELSLEDGHVAVTTVARLEDQKGYEFLLQTAALLAPRWPAARFLWVGDGELRGEMARKIEQLGLGDRIRLLGTRTDIADILAASDLFAFASISEGMPNAVLEAMAVGLPVVATDAGGTGELVVPGVTGWLVPTRDPAALVTAMDEALGDPKLRRAMGGGGRSRAEERFTVDRYVEGFEALYERLLAGGEAGPATR